MTERKMATIREITAVEAIPGADRIEVASINGWKVVVNKGEFSAGGFGVFCEIDSWIPTALAPFLSKGSTPRVFNGVEGERLRTVRLRKQLSQGLLMPVSVLTDMNATVYYVDGMDVTEVLGIQKWERPVPAHLQGQIRGNFPSFIRKTDQERIQNLPKVFDDVESQYEITTKMDGSSMTIWFHEEEWGVCSRNINLKLDQEGNTFVDTAKKAVDRMLIKPTNLAIQGELMGPGIQGNREGLMDHQFYVFDIWDTVDQCYWTPDAVRSWCRSHRMNHVPYLGTLSLKGAELTSMNRVLAFADGLKSMNNPVAEGAVFKRVDGQFSFKAIANRFLFAEDELSELAF